ncbi:MAG: DUF4325 domain-containing protein [Clostridia bacterium]|nr:DUF4325 domain-containing protein [Clostridia bacterium]
MALPAERKEQMRHYLLEKIRDGEPAVVKRTAEAFGVTPATVYRHLNDLEAQGVLIKVRRDVYRLCERTQTATLRRCDGAFTSDTSIYKKYILPALADLPKNILGIWDYICGEMINNVLDHSDARTLEIGLTRDALATTVRLTDDGVGIFEKIRSYFELEDDGEALGELYKGKMTTDALHHSGEGIFFSSRLADTFLILSSGKIFTHNRFEADRLQELINADPTEKGTTVYMSLANDSRKRAKEVFDLYADVDGGFTRTQIPLKLYFESAPVSRSQAKRLCARLEGFREVSLDFADVEWIGQGFADQVFRVFQNENPEIRLLPLNMNRDVSRMYYHVTGKKPGQD